MASPIIPTFIQPTGRLFTIADLAVFPTYLPSGDVDYELDKGRLIVMVPPGHVHGSVQAQITFQLTLQGGRPGHGRVFTEVGVVLSRNPDSVLGPDVAFVGKAKLPIRESREGYLETIPDLVVEIRSKNDSLPELNEKVVSYRSAGVGIVWVVDPESREVTVHGPAGGPRVYRGTDSLTTDELIPGFSVLASELFQA